MDIKGDPLEFSNILASAVHEIKNSLCILLSELDAVIIECAPQQDTSICKQFSLMQHETKRINSALIQLLSLFKLEKKQYFLNILHHSVYDFLEEISLQNKPLFDCKGIGLEIDCPADLFWFFDSNVVSSIINAKLNNSFKYAKKNIKVSAFEENGCLVLRMEDDGNGFPQQMIEEEIPFGKGTSLDYESTNLGLYFASLAAKAHKNKGKEGFITISNNSILGGACLTITLP